MSAQQHAMPVALVREIECVVHRTRGMGLRDVKRTEIVPVILNLRSRRHGETEVREYFGEFVHHLTDWMQRSDRKSGVEGKGVSVRVDLGGRRINTKKKKIEG